MTHEWLRTSKGKNDECYTPRYGVEPLLDFLEPYRNKTIWCPFDDETSEFVKVFTEAGFNVIYSHIKFGQDYFEYEPEQWDIMISNPPFTNKANIFRRALSFNKPFALLMTMTWLNDATPANYLAPRIKRRYVAEAYHLRHSSLCSGALFKDKELQILSFNERMQFKRRSASSENSSFSDISTGCRNQVQDNKINFLSAYFCWNFLPKNLRSASGENSSFPPDCTGSRIIFSSFRNRNQMRLPL